VAIPPFGSPPASGGSGLTSPLTTKGDLWTWGTTNARLPVGTDGYVLQADSTQTLGLGYSTHTFNFNTQLLVSLGVFTNNTSAVGSASCTTQFAEDTLAQTFSNNAPSSLVLGGTKTFGANTIQCNSFQVTPTIALGATTGATYTVWYVQPSFTGTGSLSYFYGWQLGGDFPTVTSQATGLFVNMYCNVGKTVAKYVGAQIGGGSGFGTSTLTVGLDIGVTESITGTTVWAMQIGAYNSYLSGLTTFGGTSTPVWAVTLAGTQAGVGYPVLTSAPTSPAASTAVTYLYKGATSGHIFDITQYNDAGTQRYYYTIVSGATAGAITYSATLPT
jgi:hypothetical protein